MPFVVTPPLPFPKLSWWSLIVDAESILFDTEAHYEKMSPRNRYDIATANGRKLLSIPLEKGRNQRSAMKDIRIYQREDWQTQHWRTITAAYSRSPFFEHYSYELLPFYQKQYTWLHDCCTDSTLWLLQKLGYTLPHSFASSYQPSYEGGKDIRRYKPTLPEAPQIAYPAYYQVFEERTGFLPDLSMLDLLFSEGPYAGEWLRKNSKTITASLGDSLQF